MKDIDEYFIVGKKNCGNDLLYIEEKAEKNVLIFMDSRGSSLDSNKNKTIGYMLADYFLKNGYGCTLICRPLEITIFFSLLNYLSIKETNYEILITNMGFVDFTPKKDSVFQDFNVQKSHLYNDIKLNIHELEEYRLTNGRMEFLKYMDIFPLISSFSSILGSRFSKLYLLETFNFEEKHVFQKTRPSSFYNQLKITNKFLYLLQTSMKNSKVINHPDIPDEYLRISYDGVHYTERGHLLWFDKVINSIRI